MRTYRHKAPYVRALSHVLRLEQTLEDTPGISLAGGGDVRRLTGGVCDVATGAMARASYQGQHQDIGMLVGDLQDVLLSNEPGWTPPGGGVRPQ
ncbi:hypothetical protein ACPF8X_23790 [Streptomyces sp. G35A]